MKINLHNHSLEEAKERICYAMDECIEANDPTLEIVHGHKHGSVIRDYVRSERLSNDVSKIGHVVLSKKTSVKGSTILRLKFTKETNEDGTVTYSPSELDDAIKAQEAKENTEKQISEARAYLDSTDWIKNKFVELVQIKGAMTEADFRSKYAEELAKMDEMRELINTLQA